MGFLEALKLLLRPNAEVRDVRDAVGGSTWAIDISGWLFKGCRRAAKEVTLHGTAAAAEQCVINLLESVREEGGTPIAVFDGAAYPPKKATQDARRAGRAEALQLAQSQGPEDRGTKNWCKAVAPREPLLLKIMAYCVDRDIDFISTRPARPTRSSWRCRC